MIDGSLLYGNLESIYIRNNPADSGRVPATEAFWNSPDIWARHINDGFKETDDPVPLCYCFDYDRAEVRDDIRRKGDTEIQRIIVQRVKAGECRCEETNPSGGCCLGTVAKAIRHARALKDQGLL